VRNPALFLSNPQITQISVDEEGEHDFGSCIEAVDTAHPTEGHRHPVGDGAPTAAAIAAPGARA